MSVNFKTKKGLEIVHKLVKEADVLVENYIPGDNQPFKMKRNLTRRHRQAE